VSALEAVGSNLPKDDPPGVVGEAGTMTNDDVLFSSEEK
jgi:hypothetical protein